MLIDLVMHFIEDLGFSNFSLFTYVVNGFCAYAMLRASLSLPRTPAPSSL
jgi:hypothetical protein